MKCFKCGKEALAGNKFCPHCGASMSVEQPIGSMMQNQGNYNPQMQNGGYQNPQMQSMAYQTPVYQNPGYQNLGYPVPKNAGDSLGMASMVLGIVADVAILLGIIVMLSAERKVSGFGLSYTYAYDDTTMGIGGILMFVAVICAVIGFILSICALAKKASKKGKAIAGLVCNGILVVPIILIIIVMIAVG